jgi:hydrogenase expression/formation protein HypC
MCIAMPGRVVSISGGRARVDFSGNRIDADIRLVDVAVGDYVLVHAGCAIEVMQAAQAEELAALFSEIEEMGRG